MMHEQAYFHSRPRLTRMRLIINPACRWLTLSIICVIIGVAPVSVADDSDRYDAVVLEESTIYTISGVKRAEEEIFHRIEILNEEGRYQGHTPIFESPYLKLHDFKCTIYDADGAVVKVIEEKDGKEICGYSGYALYSGLCYRYYTPTYNYYPYIVEYSYRIEQKTLFFWPDWNPGRSIPVRKSTYTLRCPNDFEFVVQNPDDPAPDSVVESGKETSYYYSASDIPVVGTHECGRSNKTAPIKIRFAPAAFKIDNFKFDNLSWSNLGRDVYAMYRDLFGMDRAQRELMDKLLAETGDKKDLIARLHHLLAEKSRYVAIEIGIGNWQPYESKETFQRGYGDCKDLSTMYASMLNYAGIEAKPVLLLTRTDGFIDPEFPTINRFNHVILFAVVEGDTVWIDPTCQICEADDLLAHDEDTYVLVIDSVSPGLIRTPRSSPDDNLISRTARIEVNPDKSIEVMVRIGLTGNERHSLIWLIDNVEKDKLDDYCRKSHQWLTSRLDIDSLSCRKGRDGDSSMAGLEIHGRIKNAIHKIGDKRYLDIAVFPCLSECEKTGPFDDELTRLDLEYPRKYLDSLIIHLPENWRLAEKPRDTVYADIFGRVSIAYRTEQQHLIISRTRESAAYSIYRDQLPDFGSHVEAVQALFPERLTFIIETAEVSE